ncbi:non-ribosomal peptide synthetase [Sphaerisporangium sp. B11E5]|uniref:non-ribosomal peptide synthetase n=1 Tax=Sphaerisporangium sp. B11E5 TaxID=3153563 RepID=UPI00325E4058
MTDTKRRLVQLIHRHADDPGSGVALEQGERAVTYRELAKLVEERALELESHGVRRAFVAVERVKSVEFVLDLLAVLTAGGTVVPIDPDTPAERRAVFLDLARPEFLVDGTEVLRLGGHRHPGVPPDAAFVYFTSGSTGTPKPVLTSAAAVGGFAEWFGPEFGVRRRDRFAFLTGLSFEAGLRDVFPPLAAGATLVLPEEGAAAEPEATVAWLARRDISVVTAVPSVARAWLRHGRVVCPAVRAVFFVGEPPGGDLLTGWRALFPNTALRVNSYGSTESGQATVYNRIPDDAEAGAAVPAGRPVPGTRYCFVEPGAALDAALVRERLDHPVDTGEIVLVSRSCSHGYLGMPAENAARFAALGDGVIAYRTGDLGRVDGNGDLVVVGRADDEVKINGVRVHPAEVLRAVRAHRAVRDAFVAATRTEDGSASLTAYVVPAGDLDIAELRRHLANTLPAAMIPARFAEVAELPRTRTGKVDRAALTELAGRAAPAFAEPSGEEERWVAARFAELLGVERVSAADDLFALGGDSITATRLLSRIWQDFGVRLSPRELFTAATVTGVAMMIMEYRLLAEDPGELRALLDALDGTGEGDLHPEGTS